MGTAPLTQSTTQAFQPVLAAVSPSDPSDPSPYLDQWVRKQLLPTLIVTPDLALIWANDAARQLLDERDDIQLNGESLSLGDAKRTEALRSFLAQLGAAPTAFAHPRRIDDSYFIIRAERLAGANDPQVIVLCLQNSTASDRYVWADFGSVFALTRSEVIVIKQLVSGNGADQIACALGVSVETVRTHIKRIYAKVSVSNREQLFQAVLPFRMG